MLMPKRTKHRKTFRLPYEGKAKGNTELHFGTYGLMAKGELGLQLTKSKQPESL